MYYCFKIESSTVKKEGKARGKTIFMNLIEKSSKTLSIMCAHRNRRNESKLVIRNCEFFLKLFTEDFSRPSNAVEKLTFLL